MSDWLTMVHVACGRPAFYVLREAWEGHAQVRAADAKHLDGRPLVTFEAMICDSCSRPCAPHPFSVRPT